MTRLLRSLSAIFVGAAVIVGGAALAPSASAADADLALSLPAGLPSNVPNGGTANIGFSLLGFPLGGEATVTITVPAVLGASVAEVTTENGAVTLACAPTGGPGETQCTVSALTLPYVTIRLASDGTAPIGTVASVDVRADLTTGTDPNPANNALSIPVTVIGTADLQYRIELNPSAVPAGGTALVKATVVNVGPDPATDVSARFTLQVVSGEFSFVEFSSPDAVYDSAARVATWTIGTLEVGESRFVVIRVGTSSADSEGTLTISVQASSADPVCENPACVFGARLFGVPAQVGDDPRAGDASLGDADSTDGPQLAATGPGLVTSAAPLGLALVAVGGGVVLLARRRAS